MALAKTPPDHVDLFMPDFLSLKISRKTWTTFPQLFMAKNEKEKKPVRLRHGHAEHVCKISRSISQKRRGHVDNRAKKVSKIRYFLQMTWV